MAMAKNDPIGQLTSVLDLVKGKSQTTTASNSTQSNLSQAGVQELIDQILRSNQGLAAVAQGQKSAGLYNSTVNQQLINDLLTQTTAKVAASQAGSTNTNTTTVKTNPQVGKTDLLSVLGLIGGSKLLGPSVKGLGKKLGIDNVGNDLADFLGLGSGASAGGTGAAIDLSSLGTGTAAIDAALIDTSALGSGTAALGLDAFGTAVGIDAVGSALGLGSSAGGAGEFFTIGSAEGATTLGESLDAAAAASTASEVGGAAETVGIAGSGVSAAPIIAGGAFGAYQAKQAAEGDVGDLVDSFFPGLGNATEQVGKTIADIFGW